MLRGGGQATPMVYEANGRQYVVIYPGGHHFMETPISDMVIAYGLPNSERCCSMNDVPVPSRRGFPLLPLFRQFTPN